MKNTTLFLFFTLFLSPCLAMEIDVFMERLVGAARIHNKADFQQIIMKETDNQKQGRQVAIRFMGYWDEKEDTEPSIEDQMKAFRGEIENKELIQKIESALKDYNGDSSEENDNRFNDIKTYACVVKMRDPRLQRSCDFKQTPEEEQWVSPLDLAVRYNNALSVGLLLESSQEGEILSYLIRDEHSCFPAFKGMREATVKKLYSYDVVRANATFQHFVLLTAIKGNNQFLARNAVQYAASDNDLMLLHALKAGAMNVALELLNTNCINLSRCYDNKGNSALHMAVKKKNLPVVKTLCEKEGIDVNAVNNKGESVLHQALGYCKPIAKFLLNLKDIDVNKQDAYGHTALHLLVNLAYEDGGYMPHLRILLSKKDINVDIQNNAGSTALELLLALDKNTRRDNIEELFQKKIKKAAVVPAKVGPGYGDHKERREAAFKQQQSLSIFAKSLSKGLQTNLKHIAKKLVSTTTTTTTGAASGEKNSQEQPSLTPGKTDLSGECMVTPVPKDSGRSYFWPVLGVGFAGIIAFIMYRFNPNVFAFA